jgi:hypothetical protein
MIHPCPQCNGQVAETAITCPHCGHQLTEYDREQWVVKSQKLAEKAAADARMNRLLRFGAIALGLVVAYFYFTGSSGNDDGTTRDKGQQCHDATSAKVMTKQLVLKRLKAPSTAEWCNTATDFDARRDGEQWTVTGCVDSQNGFGAMIRMNFVATLKCSPSGWNLVDLATK